MSTHPNSKSVVLNKFYSLPGSCISLLPGIFYCFGTQKTTSSGQDGYSKELQSKDILMMIFSSWMYLIF